MCGTSEGGGMSKIMPITVRPHQAPRAGDVGDVSGLQYVEGAVRHACGAVTHVYCCTLILQQ